ncbi:MAG TPA: type II secretion system F family protein [Clostridiaceae bacterium]|nr:type II secretion system F family protein [Clostridiaceae bacterium]
MKKKKTRKTMKGRRSLAALQWVILALIPARLASISFLGGQEAGWPAAIAGALLIGSGLARLFQRRENQMMLIQYQHLLGYLSTRLAAGVPLEYAFLESVAPMTELLGRHNPIVRSLEGMQKNLRAQMSLPEAVSALIRDMGLPVCRRDFTMLIMLAQTGGRIDVFLRQSHQDLSAQINMANEVANEKRGQASEAAILAVIPFFMARFVLDSGSRYGQSVRELPAMTLILTFLYLTAVLALFIFLMLLAPPRSSVRQKSGTKKKKTIVPPRRHLVSRWLSRLYLDGLPGQIGLSLSSSVHLLHEEGEDPWMVYMDRKAKDLLWGLLLAGLLALTGRVSWFITALCPLLFSLLRDLDTYSRASKMKEEYRFYYPSAVNSLHILLESGLTLDRSLRLVAQIGFAGSRPDNPVALALGRSALLLETGFDGAMAVQRLAERCPLPEVQSALRLMARYEREGGAAILELIRMQADRSRQLHRDALRGRAEQRSLLYVLPMTLDLIVVMATVILPALVSMQFIY